VPQIFRIAGYRVYFWSDEGKPVEPIHVHVSKGSPRENSTKIWLTKNGKTLICHNKSQIPMHELNDICDFLETQFFTIASKWQEYFDQLSFYC